LSFLCCKLALSSQVAALPPPIPKRYLTSATAISSSLRTLICQNNKSIQGSIIPKYFYSIGVCSFNYLVVTDPDQSNSLFCSSLMLSNNKMRVQR
jgi:hypothetical protein